MCFMVFVCYVFVTNKVAIKRRKIYFFFTSEIIWATLISARLASMAF
jgi:hypothetical protein